MTFAIFCWKDACRRLPVTPDPLTIRTAGRSRSHAVNCSERKLNVYCSYQQIIMQQADFSRLLDLATTDAIAVAKTMLLDELSDQYVYRIFPNQSFDGNRDADEIVYPMDSLDSIDDYIVMTRDECIRFMYREGRIPEWIDISVGAADADLTYIDCRCCGRFTDNDDRLYYNRTGRGPFGIKSPTLPRWILPGEKITRFWLADIAN